MTERKTVKIQFNGMLGAEEVRIHPTQKPVKLYNWILRNYAKKGQRILDTHVGSGSSRIACFKNGFDFVGFEIDPDYCKDSKKDFLMLFQNKHLSLGNLKTNLNMGKFRITC